MTPRLSVNVDHVATLREARGVDYPNPVEAAVLAERAGAAGITVHLRGDRRHIRERDVAALRETVEGKLNLEMAATEEMIGLALELRPDQVTLVPERPEEVTTEGGLNLEVHSRTLAGMATRLAVEGISVSLFLDPDPAQIGRLDGLEEGAVRGFEINTDAYTRARRSEAVRCLEAIREATRLGAASGLAIYAGHGLTAANVGPVAALPGMKELNIGHSIVSRSVLVGMEAAVREMLAAMNA